MGEFAALAAIASSAASVGTAFMGIQQAQRAGVQQARQAQMQAQAYADQRQQVAQQAQTEEANRMVQLRRTLGAIDALRGARGLTTDSVGASVIAAENNEQAARDLDTITLNSERQSRALGLAGSRALLTGEAALDEAGTRAMAGAGQALQSGLTLANQGYKYLRGG